MDDLIIASEKERIIKPLEAVLRQNFEISSLGDVQWYLGIEVERDEAGDFYLSQRRYIRDVVASAGLEDAKPSNIPLDTGYGKQTYNDNILPDNKQYQKLVGQLLYTVVNTRPDIAAAIFIMIRKVSCLTQQDWTELKRIVRYLKGTVELKLSEVKIENQIADSSSNSTE